MRRDQGPKRDRFPLIFGGLLVVSYLAVWAFIASLSWDTADDCPGAEHCAAPQAGITAATPDAP